MNVKTAPPETIQILWARRAFRYRLSCEALYHYQFLSGSERSTDLFLYCCAVGVAQRELTKSSCLSGWPGADSAFLYRIVEEFGWSARSQDTQTNYWLNLRNGHRGQRTVIARISQVSDEGQIELDEAPELFTKLPQGVALGPVSKTRRRKRKFWRVEVTDTNQAFLQFEKDVIHCLNTSLSFLEVQTPRPEESDMSHSLPEDVHVLFPDDMAAHVKRIFLPPRGYPMMRRALSNGRPVIFTGQPGDGKTYSAEALLLDEEKLGRPIRRVRQVNELVSSYDKCESDTQFCAQMLPANGALLLDDVFGKTPHQSVPVRLFDAVFKLCCQSPGRGTSLLMTCRRSLYDKHRKYVADLKKLNVAVFDISSPEHRLARDDRSRLFSRLLALSYPKRSAPLFRFGKVRRARKLVTKMNMSPLEIFHWSSVAATFQTQTQLENCVKALLKNIVDGEVRSAGLSYEASKDLVRISLWQGAPSRDVIESIGPMLRSELSPLWSRIFITEMKEGVLRFGLRHPCIEECLIHHAKERGFLSEMNGWFEQMLVTGSIGLRLAALNSLFRLRRQLGNRFFRCLDIALRNGSRTERYRSAGLLALEIEHDADYRLILRLRRLAREDKMLAGRCVAGIIQGWEHMPSELRTLVDRAISDSHEGSSGDRGLEGCLPEVIVQMARRPSIFYKKLEKMFRIGESRKMFYGEQALRSLIRSGEAEIGEVVRLAGLVVPSLPLSSIFRLQEEIRDPACPIPSTDRLPVLRELGRSAHRDV